MATSFDHCGICNSRHVSKLSAVWCSECDEGLCQDCTEHHSVSKASRNHNVVPIAEYQNLPSFIVNIKLYCNEHDEKYLLFCKDHNDVLCRKCVISEKHRECKELSPVEDAIQNAKTSVELTEIASSLTELKENLRLIFEDRQNNVSSLSASKKILESEISSIREQINHHLDKIQDHFIAELEKAVENSTKQIQSFLESLAKHQREIDDYIEDVESIKKHATDIQTFLGLKLLENKLNKRENDIQSWINGDSLSQSMVSYQLNTLLQNITKEITTFGKPVVDIKPCKVLLQRRKESQAQLMKVNAETKGSVKCIALELKTKINTQASDASGCCILPCGKFVVSKYDPSYLILFAPDGKIEKEITIIMSRVIDVACVDNETVVVISNEEKNIHLVSLKSGTTFRKICTTSASNGFTYTGGSFIVCSLDGRMQEVMVEDNKTNFIGGKLITRYITSLGDRLYSVKKDTNTIVCHKRNGDILWTFTDEEVLKKPRGITVDENGNAIVAGVESNNVIAISSDGTKHKILLSQIDLCGSPWAVSYHSILKYLLVSNEKDGQVFLYSVKGN